MPNRLPYGTKLASAIFVKVGGNSVAMIERNDLVAMEVNTQENLDILKEGFEILRRPGFKLKMENVNFSKVK